MTFQESWAIKIKQLRESSSRTILAIDSSTQMASIAIHAGGKQIFYEECLRQKSHSEWFNPAIKRSLASASISADQIEVLAVSHGPGSFTGIRVATNLVKTLAYAYQLPIVSMSSLELLAEQTKKINGPRFVMPAINAFKNMIFLSLYQRRDDGKLEVIISPLAVEVDKLNEFIKSRINSPSPIAVQVVGDGYHAYRSWFDKKDQIDWIRTEDSVDYPLASTLANLTSDRWESNVFKQWQELTPTYIRASAAEENKNSQS